MAKHYPTLNETSMSEGLVKKNPGHSKSYVQKVRLDSLDEIVLQNGTVIDMKSIVRDVNEILTMITAQDPTFAPYVHELEIVYTWAVKTMATDYSRIFINPLWTSALDFDTKAFILYHEFMHCLLDHYTRRKMGNFEPKKWNWAADYEINAILIDINPDFDESIFKGPAGGLYKKEFLNVPAEEIYHQLPAPPPQSEMEKLLKELERILDEADRKREEQEQQEQEDQGNQQGEEGEEDDDAKENGDRQWDVSKVGTPTREDRIMREQVEKETGENPGGAIDPELGKRIAKEAGLSDEEIAESNKTPETWDKLSKDMLNRETRRGNKASGGGAGNSLVTILGNYHNSVVNWRAVLKKFVAEILARTHSKWTMHNRRYMAQNPDSIRIRQKSFGNVMKRIIVCMDTSGSMEKHLLQQIIDEINAILRLQTAEEIIVLWFDSEVKPPQVLKRGQKAWAPAVVGGGGTNFQTALDFIKTKYKDDLSVCLFFTDGYEHTPKKPSYYDKFIWIVYDNPMWPNSPHTGDNPAFGKVIHVTTRDLKKGMKEGVVSSFFNMVAESIQSYIK